MKEKIIKIFNIVKHYYKLKFNIDLSQVQLIFSNQVLDEKARPISGYEDSDGCACWETNPEIICIRPIVVFKKLQSIRNYKLFLYNLIAHELAHIVYHNYTKPKVPIIQTSYTVDLKIQNSTTSTLQEESYCDSLSNYIVDQLLNPSVRNTIKTCYNIVVKVINKMFGVDLSYIKLVISPFPHYNDGRIVKGKPIGWSGGSYCHNGKIYINPDYKAVWNYWKADQTSVQDWYIFIIAHELGHALDREHHEVLPIKKIEKDMFSTVYLDSYKNGDPRKYMMEKTAEWVAKEVMKFIKK